MPTNTTAATTSSIMQQNVTLLDLLDRLLETGVVVRGDLTISVADVDLIYLQANVLLTSISKLQEMNKADTECINTSSGVT